MVQYIVKSDGDKIPSWKIVEVQGELTIRDDEATGGFNQKYFGDIHFEKNGDPLLIIGHHSMTGKVVKLDRPFAVLAKESVNGKTFNVKALIKEKIVFKTRPKPIITHVPTRFGK